MTTIVYREGTLAADSGVFDRGVQCGTVRKIAKSPSGSMGGVAGCLGDSAAFLGWLKSGAEGEPPEFKDDESEGILVSPDGKVEWIGRGRKRFEIKADYYAIGSGFAVAMGALEAGAGATTAIRIACKLDVYTSLPFTHLHLNENAEPR
ncbi:MAG: hypothetical protein JJ979_16935 [Roseibium sp.]|nr:hypothetical protein [Roseibium sp.]